MRLFRSILDIASPSACPICKARTWPGDPSGPGYLLRFRTTSGLGRLHLDDPRIEDMVAGYHAKSVLTESESLILRAAGGIATEMRMSPEGTVVSFTHGEIYEIHRPE